MKVAAESEIKAGVAPQKEKEVAANSTTKNCQKEEEKNGKFKKMEVDDEENIFKDIVKD